MTTIVLEDKDKFPPELSIAETIGEIIINKTKILEPIAIYVKSLFKKPKQILVYRRGMRNIFCIDDEKVNKHFPESNPFVNIPCMENSQISLHYEFWHFRLNFAYLIGKSLRSKSTGNEVNAKFGISPNIARVFFWRVALL